MAIRLLAHAKYGNGTTIRQEAIPLPWNLSPEASSLMYSNNAHIKQIKVSQ